MTEARCPNCGASLHGPFCARCGQKESPLDPPFSEFLRELVHEIAHVDSKVVQSVRLLLTRPGFLSREHFEGRRMRYVSPIRLYLLSSVLYFAVVAFAPLAGPRISCTTCPPEDRARVEQEMREAAVHWTPRAMFVLVPMFAGLIALAARRSGRNYPQHLYFAMHIHTAWFVLGVVAAVAGLAHVPYITSVVSGGVTLYAMLYLVLAFRRAYDATFIRSILSSAIVTGTYMLVVMVTLLAIILKAIPTSARTPSAMRLWVLQPPDQLVEYDATMSAVGHAQTVPRRIVEHPEYFSINASGQMLFLPPPGAQWAAGEMATSSDRAWFWDGRRAMEWTLAGPKTSGSSDGQPTVIETARQWLLSARGESLFWIEHRFEKVMDPSGGERSMRPSLRVWRSNGADDNREEVAAIAASEWCECTTGVCSESCPVWSVWAPDGIIDDFFLVTRMTEGQIDSRYHESSVYQRSGSKWIQKTLPQAVEAPLAASEKGDVVVTTVPDAGCCGWENESNDQLLLLRNGKSSVLYDEARRYDNRDYDVSFYPSDAKLSPAHALVAFTLVSSAHPDGEIRLSSDGKEDAGELARVRRTIAELPAVEIAELGAEPRSLFAVPRAGIVGWLSRREILVAQNDRLTVYDIQGARRKETPIRVRGAGDAFLR
jgi:hypothetical protein